MAIFIHGINSRLSKEVIHNLYNLEHEVIYGCDRNFFYFFNGYRWEIIDSNLIPFKKIKLVVNFVGSYKNPMNIFDSNIIYLLRIHNRLVENKENCKFIHISSISSTYFKGYNYFDSNSPVKYYAYSRFLSEKIIQLFFSDFLIIQCSTILFDNSNSTFLRILYSLKASRFFHCNSTLTLNLTYVDDVNSIFSKIGDMKNQKIECWHKKYLKDIFYKKSKYSIPIDFLFRILMVLGKLK